MYIFIIHVFLINNFFFNSILEKYYFSVPNKKEHFF
uniref:Uncharacterized protein n=1 Tax=viral metagenome TaxID=1070528 RepID=A0A6C0AF55_9ZZZZ